MAAAKNVDTGRGPGGRAEMGFSAGPASLKPLLPLYAVVFAGFVGYSLMITVFTPMIMSNHDLLLRADEPMSRRVILLGILLCLYPLGQFAGSPVLGALSDRFGRKPVLMISLCFTTGCYALIGIALSLRSIALLAAALLLAGLAEANVVAAQSAIADVITPEERNRFFGYIYLSASSAYIVGPLVGGKLADPDLVSWFNDATPFWAAMIVLAITTAATGLFFRETNPPAHRHSVSFSQAFTNLRGVDYQSPSAPVLLAQLRFLSCDLWIFPVLSHVPGGPLPSRRVSGFGVCGMGGRSHCDRQRVAHRFSRCALHVPEP